MTALRGYGELFLERDYYEYFLTILLWRRGKVIDWKM
jgi:hypothetical protein